MLRFSDKIIPRHIKHCLAAHRCAAARRLWITGLSYTILDKITPLWKRISEPPEIQIVCYRGDPGQWRHSGSSYDLF